jgi:hypothetical protein
MFAAAPAIAAMVGYIAWKGKPTNFDRGMYFTAFVVAGGIAAFLIACAIRMKADVRSWQYILQLACFIVGALIFGVAMGCGVGIFTYRRRSPPDSHDTPA